MADMRISAKADYAVRAMVELAALRSTERRRRRARWWQARAADDITLAEIIRAVEGPPATVRGEAAAELDYRGRAAPLRDVWLALRANIRQVLESVTLADVVAAAVPEPIGTLAEHRDA